MSLQPVLDYLTALEQNNDRDWYHAHKPQLTEAQRAFEEFLQELLLEIRGFDSSIPLLDPRALTFKLNRDTRFSRDKSPYNPAFRAHIAAGGKLPVPVGYYVFLRPGGRSFLGGGLFADMFPAATTLVRDHIAAHGEQWQALLDAPNFSGHFTLGGTALKKVPQGYDPAHPQASYLRYKSWYVEYPLEDGALLQKGFVSSAAGIFHHMQPFNAFLNQALEGFQMPARP